jgi:MFS family permease
VDSSVGTPINEARLINRLAWRLMPLLGLLYLVAYIDRQNISFAKLQMLDSLGMSEVAYGLGASLFFIGYLLFEVPSNVMLHRHGAPRWLARIMLTWGIVTILLAYTQNATMFYVLRFLLGASEAGLYPGVIYYLTLWFPARHRVRMLGYFTVGSSLGNMIGAPICGYLLDRGGLFGLQGWQLVFLITGLPSVLLSAVVLFYLPRTPLQAKFLSAAERTWLSAKVEEGRPSSVPLEQGNPFRVLGDARVLWMSFFYMMVSMSVYGLSYWLPTLVKGFGVSNTVNGLINIAPWLCATLVLVVVPPRLQKGNRTLGAMLAASLIGVACFLGSVMLPTNTLRFIALCCGAPCMYMLIPCFWTLPPKFLSGARAAAGIAAINSLGNVGGFIAQNLVPWVRQASGSTRVPMLVPAACLLIFAAITCLLLRQERRKARGGKLQTAAP